MIGIHQQDKWKSHIKGLHISKQTKTVQCEVKSCVVDKSDPLSTNIFP